LSPAKKKEVKPRTLNEFLRDQETYQKNKIIHTNQIMCEEYEENVKNNKYTYQPEINKKSRELANNNKKTENV
jgi:pyocin large subunit-like protein